MDNKKYAMYLRKSRADIELEALGEEETLSKHKSILYKLAERKDILPDQITVYHELVSGESIQQRPEIQRLISDLYQKKYVGVLVVEIERLARGNTTDQGIIADAFQASGTEIITPVKTYDPNNEFDQEFFEFGLFMSRREYKTIRRRMEAGKIEAIEQGNYVGASKIYGYDVKKVNKAERILIENTDEAPIVRMIFNWFTEDNLSLGSIAKKLTNMHIPSPSGRKEWSYTTIRDILHNPHYIGKIRWYHRKIKKKYDEIGRFTIERNRIPAKECLIVQGKHKAIVTEEQFYKAQGIIGKNTPIKDNFELSNVFAGLLFCSSCGKSMRYQSYKNHKIDRIIHKTTVLCHKKSAPIEQVKKAFIDGIKGYIADFQLKIEQNADNSAEKEQKELIKALKNELLNQEKKKEKLFEAYESQEDEELYTKEEFIKRKQQYNSAIENLKQQIKKAEEETIPKQEDFQEKIISLHKIIDMINDPYANAEEVNRFLKSFISRINYDAVDLGEKMGSKVFLDIILK